MGLQENSGADVRFEAYATKLAAGLGHADRVKPFQDYCVGLLTAEGRKSVEPLAALTAPERTAAQHQSLLHFVAAGPSSDATMLSEVRAQVLPVVTRKEPVQALIVDDTSFPKKGKHSVGVTRQYCGERGKQDNCQVAVSLSVATHQASLPIAYQLYLPQDWADDADRRATAGVPAGIAFQTKPEIALAQLRAARSAGLSAVAALARACPCEGGRPLWQRWQVPRWDNGRGTALFGRGVLQPPGLAAWRSPAAARRGWPKTAAQSWREAPAAGPGQGAGDGTSRGCLADDHLAGGQQHRVNLAVCAAAGAPGAVSGRTRRTRRGRMAADRMAGRRS